MNASIAILLTCYNRREKTLECLRRVAVQEGLCALDVAVFLMDDGSTDGTADEVVREFPCVRVLDGNGSLYWNGGMRAVWSTARKSNYDFYLWLNDDTLLYPDAVKLMLETHDALVKGGSGFNIVVGTTQDPDTQAITYGGIRRVSRWHPLRYEVVPPAPRNAVQCESVNGNCVLIPRSVVDRIGILDDAFTHAMGDFDYALRASSAGCGIWVAPGYVGTCTRNDVSGTWSDPSHPFRGRWRQITSVKGLPWREWMVYAHRHAGPFWPVFWASPYIRTVCLPASRFVKRLSARHGTKEPVWPHR
jgi:GT2 family glycosyltransferase